MSSELLAHALGRSGGFSFEVTAYSANEILDGLAKHHPEVAVISANMENVPRAGLKVLREIRQRFPEVRPILLVDARERDLIVQAFRDGAKGIFSRTEPFQSLCKAIVSVYDGQVWANTEDLGYLLEALATMMPSRVYNASGVSLLTQREEEILRLVAEGLTNREIARKLKLSEHTVKNYMFRMFDKLGVSSRVELILYALNKSQQAA
jgi:DNA-binding NarL/FixJ family response regulator